MLAPSGSSHRDTERSGDERGTRTAPDGRPRRHAGHEGPRVRVLRDRIAARGVDVVLVDAGILGEPLTEPDVTRQEVAAAAGADVQALADAGDRAAAIEAMGRGAAEIVLRLHAEGRLDAIGALGGTGGTTLATHAMRALPIGVPKLMVSTVASGDTSSYVGSADVTMMYSVVDVAGINRISSRILANAAGTLVGMATEPVPGARRGTAARRGLDVGRHDAVRDGRPGAPRGARLRRAGLPPDRDRRQLDGGADRDRPRRGRAGRHPDGARRRARGRRLARGPGAARGRRALGIPQVVSLGGLDLIAIGPPGAAARALPRPLDLPPRRAHRRQRGRRPEESAELAAVIARKLNAATGPVALFVPLRGFSPLSIPGAEFDDAAGDAALFEGLRELIDPSRVELHEVECDINDPELAVAMASACTSSMTG